jgi:hemerythrin-like metal-binding protein
MHDLETLPDNYTWSDQYRVHIHTMDEQHRALFTTAGKLYRLLLGHQSMSQIDTVFSDLVRQTIVHFHTEEALMQRYAYPDYNHHKSLHDFLVQQLEDMQLSQQNMQSLHYVQPWIERLEVADFLSGWLVNHIVDEDKKLGVFLQAAQRS